MNASTMEAYACEGARVWNEIHKCITTLNKQVADITDRIDALVRRTNALAGRIDVLCVDLNKLTAASTQARSAAEPAVITPVEPGQPAEVPKQPAEVPAVEQHTIYVYATPPAMGIHIDMCSFSVSDSHKIEARCVDDMAVSGFTQQVAVISFSGDRTKLVNDFVAYLKSNCPTRVEYTGASRFGLRWGASNRISRVDIAMKLQELCRALAAK